MLETPQFFLIRRCVERSPPISPCIDLLTRKLKFITITDRHVHYSKRSHPKKLLGKMQNPLNGHKLCSEFPNGAHTLERLVSPAAWKEGARVMSAQVGCILTLPFWRQRSIIIRSCEQTLSLTPLVSMSESRKRTARSYDQVCNVLLIAIRESNEWGIVYRVKTKYRERPLSIKWRCQVV